MIQEEINEVNPLGNSSAEQSSNDETSQDVEYRRDSTNHTSSDSSGNNSSDDSEYMPVDTSISMKEEDLEVDFRDCPWKLVKSNIAPL